MSAHTPGFDELLAVCRGLIHRGHFYDCHHGRRGGEPDDFSAPTGPQCSNTCIHMRNAIAKAEGGQ